MAWHVVTLDRGAFEAECSRLEDAVKASGFAPDAVLGICEGGRHVAMRIMPALPHFYCRLQRPSTPRKSWAMPLVRRLPRALLDRLRIAEARWLNLKQMRDKDLSKFESKVHLPADLPEKGNLLIIDDAVDSGTTLLTIINALKTQRPKLFLRSAVITTTANSPKIAPDITIYNNNTLIRFPWSKDMNQTQQ